MLVQRLKTVKARMAQIALILASVPRCVGGDVRDLVAQSRPTGDEARGVGDDVGGVILAYEPRNNFAVSTRATVSRLKVQDHGGAGDKGLSAALERAANISGAMGG